jgi:hypothetical protein
MDCVVVEGQDEYQKGLKALVRKRERLALESGRDTM